MNEIKFNEIRNGDKIRVVDSYKGYEGEAVLDVALARQTSQYIDGKYEDVCLITFGVEGMVHVITANSTVYLLERKKSPGQIMFEAYNKTINEGGYHDDWDSLSGYKKAKWHRFALVFQDDKEKQK